MNSTNKSPQITRLLFFLTVIYSLLLSQPLMAREEIKNNLVSVKWLEKNYQSPGLILLDASPAHIYSAQHIPGAINYDIFTYGVQEMPITEIEKRYQSWGISPGKKIIIYDQGGTHLATRLFFSLEYYGFPVKNIFILDGGMAKWQEAGLTVTKEATAPPKKGSFVIKNLNKDIRADLPEFLTASGDQANNILIDALDANWHFGANNFFGRPGHIPNAVLIPVADFYNPDKTFKSPEEIKNILTYFGIKPAQQVYTHCGGGIAASVPFFALRFLLDYPKVKLYPGSQLEWLSDQRELPFWTYAAPFLMRETSWLQSWGGKMFRMYGISQVSIVDVRTETAYNEGHVPFAINIPIEIFRNNINSPDKLADILGKAGIHASHEAVIISGGGLTKESALAFVMLEKSGQKKVSVFMDSLGKSERLGIVLTKDKTIVGPKRSPQDLSIIPMDYPLNTREGVIIADAKSTKGLYPKVFIASGKNLSTQVRDGKLVHIPYSELLNNDGTPKAAKDIWNILAKAGVTRYAELVCFSDDPGEAAVSYYILKLMGFPDIKMLEMK